MGFVPPGRGAAPQRHAGPMTFAEKRLAARKAELCRRIAELPTEEAKPVEDNKPVQPMKPSQNVRAVETVKSVDTTRPVEAVQSVGTSRPVEPVKSAQSAGFVKAPKPKVTAQPVKFSTPVTLAEILKSVRAATPAESTKPNEFVRPVELAEAGKHVPTREGLRTDAQIKTPELAKVAEPAKHDEGGKTSSGTRGKERSVAHVNSPHARMKSTLAPVTSAGTPAGGPHRAGGLEASVHARGEGYLMNKADGSEQFKQPKLPEQFKKPEQPKQPHQPEQPQQPEQPKRPFDLDKSEHNPRNKKDDIAQLCDQLSSFRLGDNDKTGKEVAASQTSAVFVEVTPVDETKAADQNHDEVEVTPVDETKAADQKHDEPHHVHDDSHKNNDTPTNAITDTNSRGGHGVAVDVGHSVPCVSENAAPHHRMTNQPEQTKDTPKNTPKDGKLATDFMHHLRWRQTGASILPEVDERRNGRTGSRSTSVSPRRSMDTPSRTNCTTEVLTPTIAGGNRSANHANSGRFVQRARHMTREELEMEIFHQDVGLNVQRERMQSLERELDDVRQFLPPADGFGPSAETKAATFMLQKELAKKVNENLDQSKRIAFLERQLSDVRGTPGSTGQRSSAGASAPGPRAAGSDRLLAALKQFNFDMNTCSECWHPFHVAFRGVTEDPNCRQLILKCTHPSHEMPAEVFRWDV